MPLILAIEPDRRQAAQLSVVVRKRVHAELILVDTTERALDAIGNRMPDLVLVPALLSPQDDAALAAALRVIAAAAHVQMLTIPVLGAPRPAPAPGGMLSALRRGKTRAAEPDGCDPAVFAEQVAAYLERATQERPTVELAAAPAETAAYAPELRGSAPAVHVEPAAVEAVLVEPAAVTPLGDLGARDDKWSESTAAEGPMVATPDESVTFALEEAVRALFAAPAPVDPPAPIVAEQTPAAASAPERPIAQTDSRAAEDEDDLIAALMLIPLTVVELIDEDGWIGSGVAGSDRALAASGIDVVEGEDLDPSRGNPSAPGGEREWVALVASLRADINRLRGERDKPGHRVVQGVRSDRKAKPAQDEWGFFDPEQCGFAALLAKLDEVTDSEDSPVKH